MCIIAFVSGAFFPIWDPRQVADSLIRTDMQMLILVNARSSLQVASDEQCAGYAGRSPTARTGILTMSVDLPNAESC